MARRKKGDKIDGWVVLDKPEGMTSTQAVARVKRLFKADKAGHAGTLDPLPASPSVPPSSVPTTPPGYNSAK